MKLLLFLALLTIGTHGADRPNVILIISDDHGFSDYGFMGNEAVRTPNLDRMAAESLLYPRGYVMPVCSPSLASLLTGQLPHVHGITGNDLAGNDLADKKSPAGHREKLATQLLSNDLLLPKALSEAGYLTFQTGKLWNVTFPEVGFTHGMTDTEGRHGGAGLAIGREGLKPIYDFIQTAQAEKKPFFIWHAPFLPHTPHNPPPRLLEKYAGKGPTSAAEKYYAMVAWLDESVGELDAHIEKNGLKDNTVIIYLADNGWDAELGGNGTRAKLSPYELGIRTPIFIRWPGKVQPERDETSLASIIDIAPTISKIADAKAPETLPGLDLLDREAIKKRDTIFIEAYTHDIADLEKPAESLIASVVISGWWKLILPGPVKPDRPFSGVPEGNALFDLKTDRLEKTNLAGENPEVVDRLIELQINNWIISPPATTEVGRRTPGKEAVEY